MNLLIDHIAIFILALVIDLTVGDPSEKREKFYPVVWISRLMYFFDRITRRGGGARREKMLGVVYPLLILAIFVLPCLLLLLIPPTLSPLYIVLGALIFKMTFTIKGLECYGKKAMEATDLEQKREAVGKIVSRDVEGLDDEYLNSATVESIAENLTDSVIAPFFYFSIFGVFGAMIYRVINTLDAVIGYKTEEYIHLGWFSARTDDLLNYVPERIAAYLILLLSSSKIGTGTSRRNFKRTIRTVNSGNNEDDKVHLTIVAMSHALQVKLEKKGHYAIGTDTDTGTDTDEDELFERPSVDHIEGAIRIMKRSSLFFAFVCIVAIFLLHLLLLLS